MLTCALLSLLFFFFPFRVQLCHLLWIHFFTPENRQAIGMIPFTCRLFDHLIVIVSDEIHSWMGLSVLVKTEFFHGITIFLKELVR